MPLVRVAELDDRRLAPYRALKKTNESSRRGLFIAEGDKLVRRLLDSGLRVESVLLSEPYVDAFGPLMPAELTAYVVPDTLVEPLVGYKFHRGILACGVRPASPPLEQILAKHSARSTADGRTIVVCPNVQDPENIGAIARIAGAFGVDALALGPDCADPFSRRVQRVSMGGVYRLPILNVADAAAFISALQAEHGFESWATVLDADSEPLAACERPARLALVFGSEGHGIPSDVVAACRRKVIIPMPTGVDSLNVAVAAGIFLYELTHARLRCD